MSSSIYLHAELVALVLAYLPYKSLAHDTLRVNTTFREATRMHIDTVVLPAIFGILPSKALSTTLLQPSKIIGDAGMQAFASAIATGALRQLTVSASLIPVA
jgi:hypothetical protein